MSESNNDHVICPNCVHQFRAIPVNVQAEIDELRPAWENAEKENTRLTKDLESLQEGYGQLLAENTRLKKLLGQALGKLKRYHKEVPLGHQPHMIALDVENLIQTIEKEGIK